MSVSRSVSRPVSRQVARSILRGLLSSSDNVVASFTRDISNPYAGQWIQFTNTSVGAVSYLWDFGDGTTPDTQANPTHFFVNDGTYTVSLTSTSASGSTSTATATITMQQNETVTLQNKPYTSGTVFDLTTATLGGVTLTPNSAIAPDGTNTAFLLNEGTATSNHFVYFTPSPGGANTGDFYMCFYVKKVDMPAISIVQYYNGVSGAVVMCEVDLTTKKVSQGLNGANNYVLKGTQVYDIGGGYLRVSMSYNVATASTPNYFWINASPGGVPTYDANCQLSYTGTNKTCYIWGLHFASGIDNFDPDVHYLGPVQGTPPTKTLRKVRKAQGHTLTKWVDFSLGDLTSANFSSTYGFDFKDTNISSTQVPVGAKYDSVAGVGWHQKSTDGQGWKVGMNIGIPAKNGIVKQVGAWVYLEFTPTPTIGIFNRFSATSEDYIAINSSLQIETQPRSGSPVTVVSNPVPVKEWFHVSLAMLGTQNIITVTKLDGTVYQSANFSLGTTPTESTNLCWGPWTPNNGVTHSIRWSGITYHELTSLSVAGRATEVVPPQKGNHIFQVNPASGNDSNNGITAPWQTVTRANAMLDVNGIITEETANQAGMGPHLIVDTSLARLDLGVTGLRIRKRGVWLKPKAGNTYIDCRAEVVVSAGSWTLTGGGHTGVYQIACDQPYAMLFSNDALHTRVADLAALDAAGNGNMTVVGSVLYAKPIGGTDPRVDGKTYRHSRFRPENIADVVGMPAISAGAFNVRITAADIGWCVTSLLNGSYMIGDQTGFGGKLIVENCRTRFGDKHIICYVITASNTEIITRNNIVEQSVTPALTSYQTGGSNNIHRFIGNTIVKSDIVYGSSSGATGAFWYAHGDASFSLIEHLNGNYGDNIANDEGNMLLARWSGCTVKAINQQASGASVAEIINCIMKFVPRTGAKGGTFTGNTITCEAGPVATAGGTGAIELGGTVVYSNNILDMHLAATDPGQTGVNGLFVPGTALALTFTNNTIKFGSTGNSLSMRVLDNMVTGNIVAMDYNEVYIDANATYVRYNGVNYTFAAWKALGVFDQHSNWHPPL